MYERCVKGCAARCFSAKPTYNNDVLTSVDKLLRLNTKISEVLGHSCKYVVCDALGSTERPHGRTSAASFDPLDLRVI
jgi:hypothetical protein